jgi:hypothetical protein
MLQDSMFVLPFLDPTAQVTENGNHSTFNDICPSTGIFASG